MTTPLMTLALILPLVWQPVTLSTKASIRGVAVSRDGAISVAGNGPEVWVSVDNGKTWTGRTPNRDDATDYRCVSMPASKVILIASAGTPALILRSENLGETWKEVFNDDRAAAFIDGMQFWDSERGIAFGDPVDGRFLLLKTDDGGETWNDVDCKVLPLAGEAGFAASNGSLALPRKSSCMIGLGARHDLGASRVLISDDTGQTWNVSEIAQIPAGPSSGIFALTIQDSGFGIAVGGDYKLTEHAEGHVAVTKDLGRTWRLPTGVSPHGFRSSVIFVPATETTIESGYPNGFWLTTGPSGTDISEDGEDWKRLSDIGFHALNLTANGTPLAVGSDGRVALLMGAP